VFVGIAPGEEEENAGEPFVGPSGRRLKRAVSLGAERTPIPCSKINLFNCRTIKVGFRGQIVNRDPTAREIKECWKRWLGPLLLSTDAIVVPLGTLAYKYIVEKPLEKHDGTTIKFGHALGHRLRVPRRIWQ
jgi:DNA polymerase